MADPQVLTTLYRKRDEIERVIVTYEKRAAEARRDLSHVHATIQLFEAGALPDGPKPYQDVHRLFERGEMVNLCKKALAERGPMDTRELSHYVMEVKGFAEDNELRKAIAYRIVQALRQQAKRRAIEMLPKRKGVRVWNLAKTQAKAVA